MTLSAALNALLPGVPVRKRSLKKAGRPRRLSISVSVSFLMRLASAGVPLILKTSCFVSELRARARGIVYPPLLLARTNTVRERVTLLEFGIRHRERIAPSPPRGGTVRLETEATVTTWACHIATRDRERGPKSIAYEGPYARVAVGDRRWRRSLRERRAWGYALGIDLPGPAASKLE